MIIWPYEYNIDLAWLMRFHFVPHLPWLVILKIVIYVIIFELKID